MLHSLSEEQLSSLTEARQKARELQEVLAATSPRRGVARTSIPSRQVLIAMMNQWLPEDLILCQSPEICDSAESHQESCSARYWREQAGSRAELIERFSKNFDSHSDLAFATGLLYQLDYPRFPHDRDCENFLEAHPFPLLEQLSRKNVSNAILLALLENSSHLDLEFTTPLSLALRSCCLFLSASTCPSQIEWPKSIPADWIRFFEEEQRNSRSCEE